MTPFFGSWPVSSVPTPDRFIIQAARDRIWLSGSIELAVAAESDPTPLALWASSSLALHCLHVVDRDGPPLADRRIDLVRPGGPLAALWPTSLRTDPDGTLSLRGLEAGGHTLLIGEGKERREVVVRPAARADLRTADERIVMSAAGRGQANGCVPYFFLYAPRATSFSASSGECSITSPSFMS